MGKDKESLPPQPPFKPGRYRHYKNLDYEAIHLALDEATLAWCVIYRPLYEAADSPGLWIRPYADFFGKVKYEGKTIPRFRLLDEN